MIEEVDGEVDTDDVQGENEDGRREDSCRRLLYLDDNAWPPTALCVPSVPKHTNTHKMLDRIPGRQERHRRCRRWSGRKSSEDVRVSDLPLSHCIIQYTLFCTTANRAHSMYYLAGYRVLIPRLSRPHCL